MLDYLKKGHDMDKFFNQRNCDRCRKSLEGKSRKMSWFTEECLCEDCSKKESDLKRILKQKGVDISGLEGCGYIPAEEDTSG